MDGQSLESEFEEQSHNMSSYGDVRVPPYLHSGLVAVITVLSFLASVIRGWRGLRGGERGFDPSGETS